jgi:EAL domain-containing protein (putative c-di-GMP-specific phosphodiesterase class I)
MQKLKSAGVGLSIDDFGTGYSSLAYLKRLPVDILKIDKSFILDIDKDENDAVIVDTIIAMARHMQIDIVAEGVETEQALQFLKSRGCRKFQGYIFGRPVPFNKLLSQFFDIKKSSQRTNVINIRSL